MSDPALLIASAYLIFVAGVGLVYGAKWIRDRFTGAEDDTVYYTCAHCRLDGKPNCYDEVE